MIPIVWMGSGAVAMACLVVAIVFLRFWRQSRDRFFLFFAAAFVLSALERLPEALMPGIRDDQPWVYVLRLVAYSLIIFAIWQKNRR